MAKSVVMLLGVVLTLVGILGFFNDPVLGIFDVDAVHNVVHLASGLVAIFMASSGEGSARTFAKVFGLVYGLVAVLGLVLGEGELLGLMAINAADNWLHVALAVVFLYVGFASKPYTAPSGSVGGPSM